MANLAADRPERLISRAWSGLALVWSLPFTARLRGGALAMAGLALLLSIATYQAGDPSLNVASAQAPHNLLGGFGASVADIAMQSLGLAAWIAGFAMISAGVAKAGLRDIIADGRRINLRFAVSLLGALFLSAALAAPRPPSIWPLEQGLGGFWGATLYLGLSSLIHIAGAPASGLIAALIFAPLGLGLVGWASGLGLAHLAEAADWIVHEAGPALAGAFSVFQRRAPAAPDAAGPGLAPEKPARARRAAQTPTEADSGLAFRPLDDEGVPVAPRIAENAREPIETDDPPFEPTGRTARSKAPLVAGPKAPKTSTREERESQAAFEFAHEGGFRLPELSMLAKPKPRMSSIDEEALRQNARLLETVLSEFGVKGHIDQIRPGPVVTLYELAPAPGVKHSRVVALADDIARSMSARSARVSVVQGRNAIGIELPNPRRDTVYLRDLLASADYEKTSASLPMALGEGIGGEPYVADLARMPHLLIAGTTGSGKSVGVNAMILSILYRLRPDQCRFIMIDPKMLELSVYDGIPHLLTPVVTDPKKAIVALKWTVKEMEDRYRRMSKIGVRNITGFNDKAREALARNEYFERTVQTGFDEAGRPVYETETVRPEPMPFLVVVIDEVADLMMVAGKDIEGAVQRLAQMARAAGIHLIMATQRPSVDVITGTIKANFPTRISFQVTSKIDARTILGEQGAEQLLGQGDMLYMAGGGRITRLHGPFVSDGEVESVAAFLRQQGEPSYLEEVTAGADEDEGEGGGGGEGEYGAGGNDLYDQAVAIVTRDRKASTSYIQRRLQIGYNRAASLIERMEKEGVVTTANHAGKRDILAGPPPPP